MEVFVSRGPCVLSAGAMNKVPGHVSPDSHPSTLGTPGQGNLKQTELPRSRDPHKGFARCLGLHY